MTIDLQELVLRLFVAAILSGAIGLERERLERGAGFRTHVVMGIGAALAMLVSAYAFTGFREDHPTVMDPLRLAAQVISGIGFLCAGTIMMRREVVLGLTTAASLWGVCCVGLAVGAGMFAPAAIATAMILGALTLLKPVETAFAHHFSKSSSMRLRLKLSLDRSSGALQQIHALTHQTRATIECFHLDVDENPAKDRLNLTLGNLAPAAVNPLLDELQRIESVKLCPLDSEPPEAE